jgi:PIN domain nuclease of toxin-antitoxin system
MLHAHGRLALDLPFETWILQATGPGVTEVLPIDVPVILDVDRLPASFHGDPADRIIVATARARAIPVATHDKRIRRSRLIEIWKA